MARENGSDIAGARRLMRYIWLLLLLLGCENEVVVLPDAGSTVQGSETGSRCVADEECEGGFCLTDFPQGYCSGVCTLQEDCPAQTFCAALDRPDFGFCFVTCVADSDCRFGYACQNQLCLPE